MRAPNRQPSKVQVNYFPIRGGLDLETQSLVADPGTCVSMVNFEVDTNGSPRRIAGYEKFDPNIVPFATSGFEVVQGVVRFNNRTYAFGRGFSGGEIMTRIYWSTGSGWTQIAGARQDNIGPPGPWQFAIYNFTGDPGQEKLFGVNGGWTAIQIDKAGAFDPIFTGLDNADDTPVSVAAHKNHLFLGYRNGSVLFSATGDPESFDVNGGAGELAFGSRITNMMPGPGGSLIITSYQRVWILYGSSAADWVTEEITTQTDSSGAWPLSMQGIGGQPVMFDGGAIRLLNTTSAFANFNYNTLSQAIRPFFDTFGDGVGALSSSVVHGRDMYRMYGGGSGRTKVISMTMRGSKVLGFGISDLPVVLWTVNSELQANGNTITVAGATDGYVYQLDTGTSFDGAPIPAGLRLHFNHVGSPSHQKRFRKAWFDIKSPDPITLLFQPTFSYGNGDESAAVVGIEEASPIAGITGMGGLWDVSEWGEFHWDGDVVNEGAVEITGSGRSISMSIFIEADDVKPFTVNGLVLHYSARGRRR
jgi:hypothetical protein